MKLLKGEIRLSEETKRKMSEARKNWHKHNKVSEESRKSISQATRQRQLGKHWYNDGVHNVRAFECPYGYCSGKLLHMKSTKTKVEVGEHGKQSN